MYVRSFFGVSAGARTRTGSVGGSNGIQFHHGHKFSAFYKLFLQLFLPSKAFFYFSLSILLFFAFFLQAFMV